MLKIGFIDHHLNNYHANKFLQILHGALASEEARVVMAWESDPAGQDNWCQLNDIPQAQTIQEVLDASDVILLLAPDNIDEHWKLCQQVLPAGKRTFIDKFLAPNLAEAKEIVSLSQKSGAPIFASSSLRYAVELEETLGAMNDQRSDEAFARGLGKWGGYGIHTIGMIQRLIGDDARRVSDMGTPDARLVTLDYSGGKRGFVEVRSAGDLETFTWQFGARHEDKLKTALVKDYNGFYENLMRRVVHFFKTGETEMSVRSALEAVAILECADRSQAQGGGWVNVEI